MKARSAFGVVTGQAGPGLLIVDGLKSAGIDVPELEEATIGGISKLLPPMTFVKNPVDTGRPGPTFAQVVTLTASDPRIDAVLVFGLSEPSVLDPAAALQPAVKTSGKPIVFGTLGMPGDLQRALDALASIGIPAVLSPERLVLAARALNDDAQAQWRLARATAQAVQRAATPFAGPYDEGRTDADKAVVSVGRAAARCAGSLRAAVQLRRTAEPHSCGT